MKHKKYICGYLIFVAGVFAYLIINLALYGSSEFELGVVSTFILNAVFGAISYIAGLVLLAFANRFLSDSALDKPSKHFFVWAFSLGFLNIVLPEMAIILFDRYAAVLGYLVRSNVVVALLAPVIVTVLYILMKLIPKAGK